MPHLRQVTKDRFGAGFERYDSDLFDFLVLHRWNRRKVLFKGAVKPLGKAPIAANWTTIPIDSKATRRRCIAEGRNMGIRLRPDQLVIDIDPRNGGTAGFSSLCFDIGLDTRTWPKVLTGSGGGHYYLRLPPDFAVTETLDDYPGVEFKSVGRQVVAAGSRHPNGRLYRWASNSPSPHRAPMPPVTLLNAIRRADIGSNGGGDGGQYSPDQLALALARLDVTEFQDHGDWLRLMFACHHATDGDGEAVFVDWSASDPQFAGHSAIVSKRWRSCRNKARAITYRTLNKILRDHDAADAQVAPDVADDEFPGIAEVSDDDSTFEVIGDADPFM